MKLSKLVIIFLAMSAVKANSQINRVGPVLTAPQSSSVVEETVHPFKIQRYQTGFEILAVEKYSVSQTPEIAVSNHINAMRNNDFEAALEVWDAVSKQKILELDSVRKIEKQQRLETWKTLFSGNRVILTSRIEYSKYIFIEYRVETLDAKFVAEETVALKAESGRYLLTLEMADSAVIQGWKKPGSRIQRLAKHAYQVVGR